MSIFSTIKLLHKINFWKTVYFNFHYLPFTKAILFPIFIYKRSVLYLMEGRIVIDAPINTGMLKFGCHNIGTQDSLYTRTIWEVSGTLIIKGKVNIGQGSKINIAKDAILTLGEKFIITGSSQINCHKQITFGKQCLLSWDILIMDTDFHKIYNEDGQIINSPKSISIGNHVWICSRNIILKGVTIGDNNIISANSTITKSIHDSNCVISGHGKTLEIVKRGIYWEL